MAASLHASQNALYASANGSLGFKVNDGVGKLFRVNDNHPIWEKQLAQEPAWVLVTNQGVVVTFHGGNSNCVMIYSGAGSLIGRIPASDILARLGRKPEGKWWTGLDLKVSTLDHTKEWRNDALQISAMSTERKHILSVKWKNSEVLVDLLQARVITKKELAYEATGASGSAQARR